MQKGLGFPVQTTSVPPAVLNLSLLQEVGRDGSVTPHLTCVAFNDGFPWQHHSLANGQNASQAS